MYLLSYFLHLALFARVQAATITLSIHENAIVPTSPGQIGVNPVTVGIGPAEEYLGPIGTDTNYLTPEGSTTKVSPFVVVKRCIQAVIITSWIVDWS